MSNSGSKKSSFPFNKSISSNEKNLKFSSQGSKQFKSMQRLSGE